MAERLGTGGSGSTIVRPNFPVGVREAVPTFAVSTALHPDLEKWHRDNLRELYDFQKDKEEGCFFIGLYALSTAFYPDRKLPSAGDFLAGIRPQYGDVLEPDKLLVPNHKLAEAFSIYEEWGMRVTGLTRNAKAEQILCENLLAYQQAGLIEDTHSYTPIDIARHKLPFAVWMHEGVTNQAHFLTLDGSPESQNMLDDYQNNKKYFVKMAIEVAPIAQSM